MTNRPIEVITYLERRRRWSREEKELLVSACFEPGAVLSEIARFAVIHVSQHFRWRKELCQIEEPSMQVSSTLVPAIVSEAAPAALPAALEAPAPSQPRRKRSDVTIELVRGRRVHVDVDTDALGRILDCVLGRRRLLFLLGWRSGWQPSIQTCARAFPVCR